MQGGDGEERRRRRIAGQRDRGRPAVAARPPARRCRRRSGSRRPCARGAAPCGRGSPAARRRASCRARAAPPAAPPTSPAHSPPAGSSRSPSVRRPPPGRAGGRRSSRCAHPWRGAARRRAPSAGGAASASPSSVQAPRTPATRPIPRRIVVPEFAQSMLVSRSAPSSSPAPVTCSVSPSSSTVAPRRRTASSVARTSAPRENPRTTVVPSASAPKRSARCPIDLSPGTVTSPRSGPSGAPTQHARHPAPPSSRRRTTRGRLERPLEPRRIAGGDERLEPVQRRAKVAQRRAQRVRVRQRDVAPQLGRARRDAGRCRAKPAAGVVEHGAPADARARHGSDQRIGDQVRQVRHARQDLVVHRGVHLLDVQPRRLPTGCAPPRAPRAASARSASRCSAGRETDRHARRPPRRLRCRRSGVRPPPSPGRSSALRAHATRLAFTLPTSVSSVPGATCGRSCSASAAHAPTGAARTTARRPRRHRPGWWRCGRRCRARAPRAGSRRCGRARPPPDQSRLACRQRERAADQPDTGDREAVEERGHPPSRSTASSASTKRRFSSGSRS